ncbi:MAG: hypothetical protein VB054_04885 [Petrimonas sp.]|nr:hypothetical protein [Petrimonas sp.]
MANLRVSGGVNISLLQNGDNLNTVLMSNLPLYQTFKKGTQDYNPNWATLPSAQQPIIFPRIYSVMEAVTMVPTNVSWKYNGIAMTFDGSGIATAPSICAGKIKQIDYNGSKALQIIGNIASDSNNDSDVITFTGRASGTDVSAEITLLIEEASANLYRLFLNMADDVIDGAETSLTMTAALFNSGAQVATGVQYEFLDQAGTVLRAKSTTPSFEITRAMIDSELMVVCKAYVNDVVVAQEQRQVWDSSDPFVIICDQGSSVRQRATTDIIYAFSLLNARTGATVSGIVFTIKVFKNSTAADITSQFTKTNTSVTVPGAKINEHKSLYVDVECTVNL